MEKELNYLSKRIENLEFAIDNELRKHELSKTTPKYYYELKHEKEILENILNRLTECELMQ